MPDRRYRVLAIATRPVQYMSPIFRRMALHPSIDLQVAYCTLRGAEAGHDPEFGVNVQWDVPLLDGYRWSHIPNRGSGDESFFGLRNPDLRACIQTGNFDAVLCYTGYVRASFWIAYFAAKLSRTAFLFGADATTLTPRDGRMWKRHFKRITWPFLYRLADEVIVPSNGTRKLMRSLGIPDDRTTLTPYSVDNDWWLAQSAHVQRDNVRASWGASPLTAIILFCAKLQPWKRPLDLLRAFAKVHHSDALLVFAGEGPLRAQIESEVASLGLASRVRFLGFVNQSQLPSIYTAADLTVLPSAYEPFGVVVNEAMLCGCPVIASDKVGAAADLVAPVNSNFIFPCGDIAALAGILQDALGDRARLSEFGRIARKHMESWSPRENIAATVEAIKRAVTRIGREQAQAQPAFGKTGSRAPHDLPK